jgi:hypothetical protein
VLPQVARLDALFVFMALCLALSLAFGLLTWVARNVWQDRRRTQLFALCAIASTVAFVILAMVMP